MAKNTTATEEIVEIEETAVENIKAFAVEARETARKAYLASLGALMWVNDEANEFAVELREKVEAQMGEVRKSADSITNDLIERGNSLQAEARTRIDTQLEDGRDQLNKRTDKMLSMVDSRMESLLTSINLPTKSSIEELNKKINSLGRKIDRVRRETEKATA